MAIGRKIVVIFNENNSGTPVIESLHFVDTFSYTGSYTSNVVVKKDDQAGTVNDRFIVTYYWANGEGPNLGTVTVATLLSDAVSQVNNVMSGEAGS